MKNNRYIVCWLQICPFERLNGGILKPNRDDYPYRLCVLDKKKDIVIDIKTSHKYNYIHTSLVYFLKEEAKKIEDGKRYAINELHSSIFLVTEEDVEKSREIIYMLENNIGFVDGNKVLSNEQYLEKILEEEKNKIKRKEKGEYYEYKGNYQQKKKW